MQIGQTAMETLKTADLLAGVLTEPDLDITLWCTCAAVMQQLIRPRLPDKKNYSSCSKPWNACTVKRLCTLLCEKDSTAAAAATTAAIIPEVLMALIGAGNSSNRCQYWAYCSIS